jgi:hypothetical protein
MKKKKVIKMTLISSFISFAIFIPLIILAQDSKLPTFAPPDLKVSIPQLKNFEKITCQEGNICDIPWLGQYIGGIQKYAIGIVGILAVIVLMIGGVIWLTAAGNQNQIGRAKKMIAGSLVGLTLVFSSYIILFLINPNLTIMKSLQVGYINKIDLSEIILEGHEPQTNSANSLPITDNSFDTTFKNFAGCIGVDWRILKGMAFQESGLDPSVVNPSGFIGLFQTKLIYCESSVTLIGFPASFCNAGVKDPAVNTAIACGMLKTNLGTINSKCSSTSDSKKLHLIYFGHSSGGGALKKAISTHGCDATTWPSNIFKGAPKDHVLETTATITGLGVSSISNTSENGQCPK